MNLYPTYDNIIIKRDDAEQLSKLIVTTIEEKKPDRGTVLAVGPGKQLDDGSKLSIELKVGHVVVFKAYSGVELKDEDGTDIVIMKEEDVIAIVA